MRTGPVILLIATAAFAAWIAPALSDYRERPGGAPTPASPATEAAVQSRREAWLAGGTAIDRAGDGHFYAEAEVDSRRVRFLVDTGASAVALTGDDARALGLAWDDTDLVPVGRGAGGTVYGVPTRLKHLELGGFEASDVDAAIIPDGLDVSLLGQSFLSKLPGVRIEGDQMILGGGS